MLINKFFLPHGSMQLTRFKVACKMIDDVFDPALHGKALVKVLQGRKGGAGY
jgi:hypothetical protein